MTKNTTMVAALVAVAAIISGGGGYWLALQRLAIHDSIDMSLGSESGAKEGKKALYWYDPMVPNQHFDKPGKSPFVTIPLVAKYINEGEDATSIKIDSGIVQNLGIRWAKVESGSLAASIDAVATVQLNGREVAVVQARKGGFVERVYGHAPGDVVSRGTPLVDLLVPDWAGAQNEFLAMLKTSDRALAQAARDRLKLLGMPDYLIARVEKTGGTYPIVTIVTPIDGLIQTLDVRTGMTVGPGDTLAKINDLDTVWLEAAIPEGQAARVVTGMEMTASFAAYPGEDFKGKVIAVLPETNADSRTLQVRIELPNHDGRFKPGMFAQVRLDTGLSRPTLLVPSESVIRTGSRNVVLVALDGGRFQPVEVSLGQESEGKIVVLDGLTEGQKIVVSGQFLIDSEASLKGVMTRLSRPVGEAPKSAAAVVPLYEVVGKVESIKGDDITLSHGPVESLGWGAMAMQFKLARPDMAVAVKPGDTVSFGFRPGDNGYVIEKLAKKGSGQ